MIDSDCTSCSAILRREWDDAESMSQSCCLSKGVQADEATSAEGPKLAGAMLQLVNQPPINSYWQMCFAARRETKQILREM